VSRDIQELETWIKNHPIQARIYAVGIAMLLLEVAMILIELGKMLR